MTKVNKNVMEQFIKNLEVDDDGNIEVTSSIARGMFHVVVKNEIADYIKTHYKKPITLTYDDVKEIADILERNNAQVMYYVQELYKEDFEKMKLIRPETPVTPRVMKKIKKYFLEIGENEPISIYEIAKAIDEKISTINAVLCRAYDYGIERNLSQNKYDDRGRRIIEIWIDDGVWKKMCG